MVARSLEQAGAQELLHVDSPSLLSWNCDDLIKDVRKIIRAPHVHTQNHPPAVMMVANRATAQH